MIIDRTRREPDPFLDWKIRIFFAGALLLAAGALLGYDVLVLLAIIVMTIGLLLMTFLATRRRRAAEAQRAQEDAWEEPDS